MNMTSACPVRSMNNLRPLDDHAVRNRCILDDYNNAVANDEAKILAITVLHVIPVDDPDITADARVLIDDGSLNDRVGSDSQRHFPTLHRL